MEVQNVGIEMGVGICGCLGGGMMCECECECVQFVGFG